MIRSASKRIVRRYLRASIREEQSYRRMILAGRIDDLINSLKKKNPNLIDQIDYLVKNDPTGRQKHLAWAVLQLKNREKPQEIIKSVKKFEDLLKRKRVPTDKKDLSKRKFPTLEALTTLVTEIEGQKSESQKKREERSQVYAETDFIKLPSDLKDRFIVAIPKTVKASCYIGRGTKWCTSGSKDNQFDNYALGEGITLYYVIDKDREGGEGGDPFAKVAFALYPDDNIKIFDANDRFFSLSQLPKEFQDLYRRYIKPHHNKLNQSVARGYKEEQRLKDLAKLGLSGSSSKAEIRDVMLNLKSNFTPSQIRNLDLSGVDFHGTDLSGVDLSGVDLRGLDFYKVTLSGADLRGVNLSGADLLEADLRNADLSGADLNEATLRGADLRGADLSGVDLSEADLSEADLSGVDLSGVRLEKAKLKKANLEGANLEGVDLSGVNLTEANLTKARLIGVAFVGTDLTGATLRGTNLRGVNLSGADLFEADLTEVNLTEANLTKARLVRVDLSGSVLSGANLSGANLIEANLERAKLEGANLKGANLKGANLNWADLEGANLDGADLKRTNLEGADLRRVDLSEVDLKGADLYEADLRGADLKGASLKGADLEGANLEGADLNGVKYDDSTLWPEGFDLSVLG